MDNIKYISDNLAPFYKNIINAHKDPNLLKELYVTNLNDDKISLDNDLVVILVFLDLAIPSDIETFDPVLFKLQLYLEENLFVRRDLFSSQQLLAVYKRIEKTLVIQKKIQPILKSQKLDIAFIYILVLQYLYNNINRDIYKIPYTNFAYQIAKAYLYRHFYRKLDSDIRKKQDFESYLLANYNQDDIFKLGVFFIEPFINSRYITNKYYSDLDFQGTFIEVQPILMDLILKKEVYSSISIPKISKPICCTLGGYYRNDLVHFIFIHKSSLHNHTITNIDNRIRLINWLQNQVYVINQFILNLFSDDDKAKPIYYFFSHFRFYHPLYIDWRGRIYTRTSILSYQGAEFMKRLILLDDPQIITNDGLKAIIIYLGQLIGLSKYSNDYILNYYSSNKETILSGTNIESPDAKYIIYILNQYYIDPDAKYNINVEFDATCSGIQHISCLLEDVDLGYLVNLGSSNDYKDPKDIYSDFINIIKTRVNDDIDKGILPKSIEIIPLTRELKKKIIKTIPYNKSAWSIGSDLAELYSKPYGIDKKDLSFFGRYLYNVVLDYKPKLKLLFNYYQKMINLLITLDIPIKWLTPKGVEITKHYNRMKQLKIMTYNNNKGKALVIKNKLNKIDSKKSTNAIKPNIIHSLDAEHLILIIEALAIDNIPLATIHDCYRIHPNNFYILKSITINKFLDLYSNKSFLEEYHNMCLDQIRLKHNIILYEGVLTIKETGQIIPEYSRKENINFFTLLKKANYHIK